MKRLPDAPADTRLMGIVHDALRRDLNRALDVLSTAPFPADAQRRAIGDQVAWMMSFLHAHHHSEDAGLWPLVRARNPEAAPLLDALASDHASVAAVLDACHHAARDYAIQADDEARVALIERLEELRVLLFPHLQQEEDELMPIVSVVVSDAEWRAVERTYNLDPKTVSQLGYEGHWLLDGLDPERCQAVTHLVPPIQRFALLHGFARRYHRSAAACWGGAPNTYGPASASPHTIPRRGRVDTVVAAPIAAVWDVVTDVTRVGEWSHECRRVDWTDGATRATPGARFRGTNKAGPWTWTRTNEVLVADAPDTFTWRTVPTRLFPDSSVWTIELEQIAGGTRITQSYEVVKAPPVLSRIYAVVVPSHRDRRTSLIDDLRRLGELASQEAWNDPDSAAWPTRSSPRRTVRA